MNNAQNLHNQINPNMLPQVLPRAMGLYLLFAFISLSLGIAFFLIWLGLFRIILWLTVYWEPAYKALFKVLNVPLPDREFVRAPITWWLVVSFGIRAVVVIFILYLGSRTLFTQGFLSQNLIYRMIAY